MTVHIHIIIMTEGPLYGFIKNLSAHPFISLNIITSAGSVSIMPQKWRFAAGILFGSGIRRPLSLSRYMYIEGEREAIISL